MLVEDLMNESVVTVDVGETVRTAVETMLRNRIGSVIVVSGDNPTGIVTETDVLQAGYATDERFSDIPTERVMSQPLVTIGPRKSLRTAMRTMRDEKVKKLPVQDGIDLVGVLTMTDITRRYSEIVQEIRAMEQPHNFRDPELRGFDAQND